MSLFRTKEWWRTECGDLRETFDGQSLLIARDLLGRAEDGPKDVIVVSSHAGYLRIYAPSTEWSDEACAPDAYKSTDLLIEAKLADCIIDVKAGKFVSGSQDTSLAVLAPLKLSIYTATLSKGSVEYGDKCTLQMIYEHQLQRFPASLTVGPFGAVHGRDFLCVQNIGGTLTFFEQEVYAFSRSLKTRLLPEPIVYVPRNDVFVTSGSDWILQCYRYPSIAGPGRKEEGQGAEAMKSVVPDWTYNIGEPILGIDSVLLSSFEAGIVVLGERTLYVMGDACTNMKSAKRLEYSALCFLAYMIEPDGKLMVIVIADTNTLMIYEGTVLKWSAQLPFAPVAVSRAQLQNLDGGLVILSEDGRLEVCYLGSEPALFVAPPVNRRTFDYVAAEKQLIQLREQAKESKEDTAVKNETTEAELTISAFVSPELLPAPQADGGEKEARQSTMCKISVELTSCSTLRALQVFIEVPKPLVASPDRLDLANLCQPHTMETRVRLGGDAPPATSELSIYATYENEARELRCVERSVQLPLKMLLRGCPTEAGSGAFSVTLKSAEPVLSFSQLFPEFIGEYTSGRQSTNSLGMQHSQAGGVVSITYGLMMNRYRLQASDAADMALVAERLVGRLRDKAPGAADKLSCTLSQQHLQVLNAKLDEHFAARLRMKAALKEIGLLTTQLRNIEKRMLRGTRERNSRSLAATGLPILLEHTYAAIFEHLDELQKAREERQRAAHNLQSSLRLLLLLLRLNVNDDSCAILESAIGFEPQLRDELDWEEVMDMALIGVQQASKGGTDGFAEGRNRPWSRFETVQDLAKLKKRMAHALERLATSGGRSGIGVAEQSIKESPAEELSI